MKRRDFLRGAAALGGAAVLGGATYAFLHDDDEPEVDSVLHHSPKDAPIDTVVFLMLENRSFDHYFGWLGDDQAYLEAGRRKFGKSFRVDATNKLDYPMPDGSVVSTSYLPTAPNEIQPYRGCGHPVPGHDWLQGRAERDFGFLGKGTGNDEYAIGFYTGEDLPMHARLAERFTLFDQYHASLLAGTFPNRQYQHAATSNGLMYDPVPLELGIYSGPTIWDKLDAAGVDAAYYYTDLPVLLLWGEQYGKFIRPIERYFSDAREGTLPQVAFVDPGFGPPLRTDDHPRGDVRLGQRFLREVLHQFVRGPQWEHGVFFLSYDEWGGFFDHVPPVVLPDDRESPNDLENFGQAGFRVPTIMASPYSMHGGVDHRVYDHTSILRFLEWRFLGAPPEGPGRPTDDWFLTKRDRFANNIGRTLRNGDPDLELHYDADLPISAFSLGCDEIQRGSAESVLENIDEDDPFGVSSEKFRDYVDQKFPGPKLTPWIESELAPDLPAASTPLAPPST
jgi:phospholipase C